MNHLKRELETISGTAHEAQMNEINRMKFTEPRSFKKKGHEYQFKHNEQVKQSIDELERPFKQENTRLALQSLMKVLL